MSQSFSQEAVLSPSRPDGHNAAGHQTAREHAGSLPDGASQAYPVRLSNSERAGAVQLAKHLEDCVYRLREGEEVDRPPFGEKILCVVLEGEALYNYQSELGYGWPGEDALLMYPGAPFRWRAQCDTVLCCFAGADIEKVCSRPLVK